MPVFSQIPYFLFPNSRRFSLTFRIFSSPLYAGFLSPQFPYFLFPNSCRFPLTFRIIVLSSLFMPVLSRFPYQILSQFQLFMPFFSHFPYFVFQLFMPVYYHIPYFLFPSSCWFSLTFDLLFPLFVPVLSHIPYFVFLFPFLISGPFVPSDSDHRFPAPSSVQDIIS